MRSSMPSFSRRDTERTSFLHRVLRRQTRQIFGLALIDLLEMAEPSAADRRQKLPVRSIRQSRELERRGDVGQPAVAQSCRHTKMVPVDESVTWYSRGRGVSAGNGAGRVA